MENERELLTTTILRVIFQKIAPRFNKIDHPFILKGGLSLKLGFNIIDRYSDDIDLSFSLELLNLKPIIYHQSDSRSYLETEAKKYDEASMIYGLYHLNEHLWRKYLVSIQTTLGKNTIGLT